MRALKHHDGDGDDGTDLAQECILPWARAQQWRCIGDTHPRPGSRLWCQCPWDKTDDCVQWKCTSHSRRTLHQTWRRGQHNRLQESVLVLAMGSDWWVRHSGGVLEEWRSAEVHLPEVPCRTFVLSSQSIASKPPDQKSTDRSLSERRLEKGSVAL